MSDLQYQQYATGPPLKREPSKTPNLKNYLVVRKFDSCYTEHSARQSLSQTRNLALNQCLGFLSECRYCTMPLACRTAPCSLVPRLDVSSPATQTQQHRVLTYGRCCNRQMGSSLLPREREELTGFLRCWSTPYTIGVHVPLVCSSSITTAVCTEENRRPPVSSPTTFPPVTPHWCTGFLNKHS